MNNESSTSQLSTLALRVGSSAHELVWGDTDFSFAGEGGRSRSIKIIDEDDASVAWQEKQDTALDEYLASHVQELISPQTTSLYKLFGAYIGNALHEPDEKKQPNVLDIGCGIGGKRPLYIRTLQDDVNYFGLDAFDLNPDREYPFICSRIETLMKVPEFRGKFDMFIFGTSLDHFENLDEVAETVRYLAAPNAKVVFWVGLHDVDLIASEEGARDLGRVFQGSGVLSTFVRSLGYLFWTFPRVFLVLMLRQMKLNKRKNLDDFHFWYFTEKDLPGVLSQFGEISDITYVPGGGSIFATCRIEAQERAA